MGNTQGFQQTYAVSLKGTESPGLSPILRAATHPDSLVSGFADEDISNCWQLFLRGKAVNAGRNACLGCRKRSSDAKLSSEFSWMSYNDVAEEALQLGTFLLSIPGCMDSEFLDEPYRPAQNLRLLGMFSKNRTEWFVCEQAANAYNFALVPLYDTLGDQALRFILENTRLRTVGCSLECLPMLVSGIEKSGYVKYILLFLDPHEKVDEGIQSRIDNLEITILNYSTIVSSKRQPCTESPGTLDSINTICFTSGSTGDPKGVLLTHGNVIACTAAVIRGPVAGDFHMNSTDIAISYLPLAHVLERLVCNVLLTIGASIGVYSGDTSKLLEDVRCLRPTVFVSVPRLFNRINDAVFRGVAQKSLVSRYFFEKGVSTKLESLRQSAATTNKLWDSVVFNKIRALMGNRLRWMISGGAPLDAIVQENMKILFCAPLMEGYGMTETFGPAFLANPKDPVSGHVGGVLPCNEFRLQSVPEMNYNVTDCPPRGELLIRGKAVSVGYFRDPEETAASLDKNGWLYTGDIAVLLPGGGLKIIDRKKNIFKLAQGEYVAPEKIEGVYLQAPMVSQIFVFGYSEQTSLVAIVVPDPDAVRSWALKQSNLANNEFSSLCKLSALKDRIMDEMVVSAKRCALKGFEKVRDIYVESEPFSVENGTLTPTLKIKRHPIKLMYQKQIDEMYSSLK